MSVEPTAIQKMIGDFSPKRDRSLVTVSALIALNRPEQLRHHLQRARDNGVTKTRSSRRSRTWRSMADGRAR
jgi:4-carboxymuconolactone decarboxylase